MWHDDNNKDNDNETSLLPSAIKIALSLTQIQNQYTENGGSLYKTLIEQVDVDNQYQLLVSLSDSEEKGGEWCVWGPRDLGVVMVQW